MDFTDDQALRGHYLYCDDLIRNGDRDRWLANLLAPAAARLHLSALYAFNLEVARVREIVSEPMPGELRLQWWRDALDHAAFRPPRLNADNVIDSNNSEHASREKPVPTFSQHALPDEARGDVQAHPIAAALLDTIRRFDLPRKAFADLIDARLFDLYDDPMPSVSDLEGYCGETSSALFRLATLILAEGRDPGGADACGHAGVAFAITGLLRALPWHVARGQVFVPVDLLARHGAGRQDLLAGHMNESLRAALAELRDLARNHLRAAYPKIAEATPIARAAFVSVALCPAYLLLMDRPTYDAFKTPIELPQWRRQWILWRASRRF